MRDGIVSGPRGQVSLALMGTPPTIELGNLGMADSLILMVLALVVFGPRRLPQIGKQIGKLMYEFRKASNDFKYQMEEELRNSEEAERRKKEEERQRTLALGAPEQASVTADPAPAVVNEIELSGSSVQPAGGESTERNSAEVSLESGLRVQPPSTGEQVMASRPGPGVTEPVAEPAASAPATTEAAQPHG